ncbi:MAG TPA: hypothetical protein P5256_00345 [Beijerinckiaceae bacterium]|nr:hypothetical protein [Rhodoblastus sp.]MCC2107211.1 hypothetical protein [Hyphomicrobiales bacterium]MCO5088644.1 hypothetical protein [Methylobacteriaceae bacterium]HRY01545.1 hypothetical protein [Beijerinckiaceae bacterium]
MIGTNGIRASSHDLATDEHVQKLHMNARAAYFKAHPGLRPSVSSVLVPADPPILLPKAPSAFSALSAFVSSSIIPDRDAVDLDEDDDYEPVVLVGALNLDLESFFTAPVGGCRYLIDNGESHRFCCESAQDGSSYCPDHHALCTVKVTKQREIRLAPSVLEQGYAPTPKEVLEPAF